MRGVITALLFSCHTCVVARPPGLRGTADNGASEETSVASVDTPGTAGELQATSKDPRFSGWWHQNKRRHVIIFFINLSPWHPVTCRDVPVNWRWLHLWLYKYSTREGSNGNANDDFGLNWFDWSQVIISMVPPNPPPPPDICPRTQRKLFKWAVLTVTFILQRHFKHHRYACVILCDVAARGVNSFQVHYLWTSNRLLCARVWIWFKKSAVPRGGKRQQTSPGLRLTRQTC